MGIRLTYQNVVIHACLLSGGEAAFAQAVNTTVPEVVDWLLGQRPVPPHYFLKAVDIVLASNRKRISDNRAFLDEVRSRYPNSPIRSS